MATTSKTSLLVAALLTGLFCTVSAFGAQPGAFTGDTSFGDVSFNVSLDGNAIEKVTFAFENWSCGEATLDGDFTESPDTPWPIQGGGFGFTVTLADEQTMRLTGTFPSERLALGMFDANVAGTRCQGNYEASNESPDISIDHSFIRGLYWNLDELPGWGFFADQQEETFFGAIYGYVNGVATFFTLQGELTRTSPVRFEGDAFSVSDNGNTVMPIGEFTWTVTDAFASAAGNLTVLADELAIDGLELFRASYVEIDEVDMLTGGNWNIIRRQGAASFGDHYAILDERQEESGIIYAKVLDNADESRTGAVAFFPSVGGAVYAMDVDFTGDNSMYYVFLATNTGMYGRYWLLGAGERPQGPGEHFRGAVDSFQSANPGSTPSAADSQLEAAGLADLKRIEAQLAESSRSRLEPMFDPMDVQFMYEALSRLRASGLE